MDITEGDDASLFKHGRRARVLELLRRFADDHVELTRHLSHTLGVHVTDAVAAAEILWAETSGEALSPARLSERLGLTTGATTTLLNRLETPGLIVRSREHTDRRIVTLRLTPRARSEITTFFASTGRELDKALDRHTDADLERVERLLTDVVDTTTARNRHLRTAASAATTIDSRAPSAGSSNRA